MLRDFMSNKEKKTYTFSGVFIKEGDWYVAKCFELDVVSQGRTMEEAFKNIQEAIMLYIDSFGTEDISMSENPVFLAPIEVFA